jgi:predicted nuclease of predicted toxin-antitoxin system
MRLYLDDDSVAARLIALLRQAGHDVQIPADIGMAGEDDAVHLTHAVQDDRVLLTHNYHDFENLHNLVLAVQGHHPGILVVRREKDRKRNLKPVDIVRAIARLEASGTPIADSYHILNAWR